MRQRVLRVVRHERLTTVAVNIRFFVLLISIAYRWHGAAGPDEDRGYQCEDDARDVIAYLTGYLAGLYSGPPECPPKVAIIFRAQLG
jgi:hypothetical protein